MDLDNCPFCLIITELQSDTIILENTHSVAILDLYPLSEGHTLVIPKVHMEDYFRLSTQQTNSIWSLVAETKEYLEESHKPDGFNVGINIGSAAGQTVNHCHIHVIPRYQGDIEDPRGGVRWTIPQYAQYWD
tara:strand:- start:1412 stop:1807 length:396 start_codon:yes stop_codon:yes gene_type:complete